MVEIIEILINCKFASSRLLNSGDQMASRERKNEKNGKRKRRKIPKTRHWGMALSFARISGCWLHYLLFCWCLMAFSAHTPNLCFYHFIYHFTGIFNKQPKNWVCGGERSRKGTSADPTHPPNGWSHFQIFIPQIHSPSAQN